MQDNEVFGLVGMFVIKGMELYGIGQLVQFP